MSTRTCERCGARVAGRLADWSMHLRGARCAAGALTRKLYAQDLRPFPKGNTLPVWIERLRVVTRGVYEGEPRAELPLAADPVEQEWVARWIDVVVELFAGPVDIFGAPARASRDALLWKLTGDGVTRARVCPAFDRGGLREARELLKPHIVGAKPELIEEFEARMRRLERK